jgi:RNA recognition motif-containing protein
MSTKLFVGNLSYSITEQELREAFAQSGRTVHSVRIALDRETQRPRGFAFIEVATDADAESAIKEWNGNALAGRNVFVEKAQERVPGAPRPAPRPRPMGAPGGGPGGFPSGPRPFNPAGRFSPMASAEPQREEQRRRAARPEKKSEQKKKASGRPKEEERERGKWRWDGKTDD